jgi:hypothetical protein
MFVGASPRAAEVGERAVTAITAFELEEAALAFAGGYDPALHFAAAIELDLARLARAQKALAAVSGLMTAHLASTKGKDQAEQLKRDVARRAGTSLKEVDQSVRSARALAGLPELEQAARAGRTLPFSTFWTASAPATTG